MARGMSTSLETILNSPRTCSQTVAPQPQPSTDLLATIQGWEISSEYQKLCKLIWLRLSAFISGAYSDLSIECHGRVFKAHKLIVCGQSEWFAKAVQKDGFQEGETGIIELPFDDPAVVKALLQYLYTFDYSVPDNLEETTAFAQARSLQQRTPTPTDIDVQDQVVTDGEDPSSEEMKEDDPNSFGGDRDLTGSNVEPSAIGIGSYRPESHADYLWRMYHRSLRPRPSGDREEQEEHTEKGTASPRPVVPQMEYDEQALPPMLFHVNVYALADRIQNKPLKTLAEKKFEVIAKKEWKSPDFPSAVEAIYSVAPPGNTGDSLRKMIIRLVVSHAKELFILDRGFTAMLQDTPDFAADLSRALAGAGISAKGAEVNVDVEELSCPGCRFTMKASIAADVATLVCPVCRCDGAVSRWRQGTKEPRTIKKGHRNVFATSSLDL